MINIKQVIQESDLSVKDFAESIGVTRQAVHNWLNGKKISRLAQKQIIQKYGDRKLPTSQGEVDTD